jgi:hypothetical protein
MTTRATEDFLAQLEQRLALTEEAAVSTLAGWLSSYEPGPLARARGGLNGRQLDDVKVATAQAR